MYISTLHIWMKDKELTLLGNMHAYSFACLCVAKKVPNVLHVSADNRLLMSVSCLEIGKFLDTVNK